MPDRWLRPVDMASIDIDSIDIDFCDGPCVCNRSGAPVAARFYLANRLEFEIELAPGYWGRTVKRFLGPWRIEVADRAGRVIVRHGFDLDGRSIGVFLDSSSLGDTLAWLPQVERFARSHPTATVYLSHFWPDLGFTTDCGNIEIVAPDAELPRLYASVKLGYFLGEDMLDRHRSDPRRLPLARIPCDILGIPFEERRPDLKVPSNQRPRAGRHACIAMESTAGCKLWHYPGGWQRVVDHLRGIGLEVVLIQKEPGELDGVVNLSGDRPIQERIAELASCELFIGPASGLAWLAWALARPVVMIGGFSEPFTEFQQGCHRVYDPHGCTGCWNDTRFTFDRSDWDWCPLHRGTERQFECATRIAPERVIASVQRALTANRPRSSGPSGAGALCRLSGGWDPSVLGAIPPGVRAE